MKLHRFRYSPYARKVQMLLDLLRIPHEIVEQSYGDREELARLTGGYIYVPVLIDDDGSVVVESRVICERVLSRPGAAERLLPSPQEGPIWAYADFIEGALEDVLFRIAAPGVRDSWPTHFERALYVLIKERKFGPGCVEAWERDRESLIGQGKKLLGPTLRTLSARPFLFGPTPTLADAALYGQCAMLESAAPGLLVRLDPALAAFARRMEAATLSQ